MKYRTTGQTDIADYKMSVFVYGESGSGKTWFCNTFPKPLFIVTEDGLTNLELNKIERPVWEVETFNDLLSAVADAKSGAHGANEAETLCLDSLSEVTPFIIRSVLSETSKSKMDRNTWGVAADKLRMFVSNFVELRKHGFHIVMTAHSVLIQDDAAGQVFGLPDTIGKFAQAISGHFDIFLYLKSDLKWDIKTAANVPTWEAHTIRNGVYPAKDRTGRLAVCEPNDFSALSEKIYNTTPEIGVPGEGPITGSGQVSLVGVLQTGGQ